jgi:hypothetical protein
MTHAEAVAFFERRAVIAFAGPAAERRRGEASRRTRTAYHEAGHVVAAHLANAAVWHATIIPECVEVRADGSRLTFLGSATWAEKGLATGDPRPHSKADPTDLQLAVRPLYLFPGCGAWRATLAAARQLRATAREVIETNWRLVEAVAAALLEQDELTAADIKRVIAAAAKGEPT